MRNKKGGFLARAGSPHGSRRLGRLSNDQPIHPDRSPDKPMQALETRPFERARAEGQGEPFEYTRHATERMDGAVVAYSQSGRYRVVHNRTEK